MLLKDVQLMDVLLVFYGGWKSGLPSRLYVDRLMLSDRQFSGQYLLIQVIFWRLLESDLMQIHCERWNYYEAGQKDDVVVQDCLSQLSCNVFIFLSPSSRIPKLSGQKRPLLVVRM
jgi:hypothetical protein